MQTVAQLVDRVLTRVESLSEREYRLDPAFQDETREAVSRRVSGRLVGTAINWSARIGIRFGDARRPGLHQRPADLVHHDAGPFRQAESRAPHRRRAALQ